MAEPTPSMPMQAPPAPGAGATQGQPPIGPTPATSPVPNKGMEAAGLAQLSGVVRQLEKLVPLLGAGSEVGKDVLKSLTMLTKHIPPGAVSPGLEQSAMSNTMTQMRQNAPLIASLRAAQQPPQSAAA